MPGKTDVTNASVPQSEETNDSSRERSGNDANKGSDVDERGVPWRNRYEEFKSKYTVLSEKHEEILERLNELEEKDRLSSAEKSEMRRLQAQDNSIDELKNKIRSSKEAEPWLDLINEISNENSKSASEQAKSAAVQEYYKEYIDDFVEDKASEFDLTPKELREKLQPYAKAYLDVSPTKRVKLAFKDFKDHVQFQKEKSDLTRSKNESSAFREDGERRGKKQTLDDAIKSNDWDTAMNSF